MAISISRSSLSCLRGGLAPLLLLLAQPLLADSPVWKIERDGRAIYLAGSVHFLAPDDYPLPPGFAAAYRASQKLVLETDLHKLQSPEFLPQMMARLTYPPGSGIGDFLEPDTLVALEEYLSQRGLALAQVASFRPGLLGSTLLVIELQRLGLGGTGVDLYFDALAREDGKGLLYLETPQEQVAFLAALGAGDEDAAIRYSLADMERLPVFWRDLLAAWRRGDMAGLEAVALEPMRAEMPSMVEELLLRRNRAWLPRLEALLADEPVELVVVGALHLAGEQGLLAELAARGYRVEQLP